ncbi:hypothetical protein VNO77_02471 [Canavalia gladiata]|uniref:Uncharacterized protein n=1 Tax=Canavalia gladiata TaxID=3824 RepID=A0AAN9MV50_CANGL
MWAGVTEKENLAQFSGALVSDLVDQIEHPNGPNVAKPNAHFVPSLARGFNSDKYGLKRKSSTFMVWGCLSRVQLEVVIIFPKAPQKSRPGYMNVHFCEASSFTQCLAWCNQSHG